MRTAHPGRTQLLQAFGLAPLAAPVAYTVILLLASLRRATLSDGVLPSIGGLPDMVTGIAAVGIPVAYAAMLAGVPGVLLLRRFDLLGFWPVAALGSTIGLGAAVLLAPALRGDFISVPFPRWLGAVLGFITSVVFWRILRRSPRHEMAFEAQAHR